MLFSLAVRRPSFFLLSLLLLTTSAWALLRPGQLSGAWYDSQHASSMTLRDTGSMVEISCTTGGESWQGRGNWITQDTIKFQVTSHPDDHQYALVLMSDDSLKSIDFDQPNVNPYYYRKVPPKKTR